MFSITELSLYGLEAQKAVDLSYSIRWTWAD